MALNTDFTGFDGTDPGLRPVTPPLSSVWATRRARALELVSEAPEAEEILSTYADLVDVQARVAEQVPVRRWLALVSAEGGPPKLRLDRLPVDELVPLFAEFLAGTAQLGHDVLRTDAGALSGTPGANWLVLFGTALASDASDDDGPFHMRAFLQPVATALAAADGGVVETAKGGRCLVCGAAPVVGSLEGPSERACRRSLICAVCGTAWRLPRPACARCGEDDATKLVMRAASSLPWVHIDVCESCDGYVKVVDQRQRPDAVPIVEDLATFELDLWAREQGLVRVQENLFASRASS
ncbi:MAG TPA: formate dehydrogenase accessory protein FdhE [Longimicrobiales bacterium]|nr:formate dehydrogenase accessory protein FdhE [Longimicrobiales bacterium]